jgi:hypothetical protein
MTGFRRLAPCRSAIISIRRLLTEGRGRFYGHWSATIVIGLSDEEMPELEFCVYPVMAP